MAPTRLTGSYAMFLYLSLYLYQYYTYGKCFETQFTPRLVHSQELVIFFNWPWCFPAKQLFWGLLPPRVIKKPLPLGHSPARPQSWPSCPGINEMLLSGINTQCTSKKGQHHREVPHGALQPVFQWTGWREQGNILRDGEKTQMEEGKRTDTGINFQKSETECCLEAHLGVRGRKLSTCACVEMY